MLSTIVIGHLHAADKEARQKLLDTLSRVMSYSRANEPGVIKFCLCFPLPEEDDGKSLFAIEEYADQPALDAHMSSPAVAELIKTFTAQSNLFSAETNVYVLPCGPGFTRPRIAQLDDPALVFASYGYQPGTIDAAISGAGGWADLISESETKQDGMLMCAVLPDEKAGMIRTVEAYESWEYLQNEHVKSPAAKTNQEQNAGMGIGEKEVWRLRRVMGYLFKDGKA
ncbi:hypothetical protein LTS18_002995 [Coniosporium uncinatum]|uniref:Uncharacterized protein n=1 Tax=Coniosporium uncinatum TaxID=93489 RepID=A0ACC3DUF7_9PEZI|nr:hypothetical protein LTS18_002995 [Coniosporium uncinatum]